MSGNPNPSRKSGLSNTYVTHCKICGHGVYHHQPRQWSQPVPLGIVHVACLVQARAVRDE